MTLSPGLKYSDCQKTLIISLGMHEGAAAPSYLRPGLAFRPCPSFGRPRVRGGESSILTPLVALKRSLNPPDRGFGSQTTFANLQPRKARPSKSAEPALRFKVGSPLGFQVGFADRDGKIRDFDAAPLERPKWPLPLSFSFSPQPRLRRAGVPVLRGPLGRPRTSSRVNAAFDRPLPKAAKEGGL